MLTKLGLLQGFLTISPRVASTDLVPETAVIGIVYALWVSPLEVRSEIAAEEIVNSFDVGLKVMIYETKGLDRSAEIDIWHQIGLTLKVSVRLTLLSRSVKVYSCVAGGVEFVKLAGVMQGSETLTVKAFDCLTEIFSPST